VLTVQQHVREAILAICYVRASCSLVFNTRCFRLHIRSIMKQFSDLLNMKSKSSRKVKEPDHETGLQVLQNEEATVQSHNDAAEDLLSREAEGQVQKKPIEDPTSHDRQRNVVTLQSRSKGRIGRSRVRIAVSETSVILQVPLS
jgi:hypothetical protein